MARAPSPAFLAQLRNASSYAEQHALLRSFKTDIVGHLLRQQKWIVLGVLDPIVSILAASRAQPKLNGKDTSMPRTCVPDLAEDEQVRLQAIQILSSFATGGPSFLAPLHASKSLSALLDCLSPIDNHLRIVLATLKALRAYADAAALASPSCPVQKATLADEIFTEPHIRSLCSILDSPRSTGLGSPALANAVAGLVATLCREDRHQVALANNGLLDSLATKIASFVVARGEVVPGADILAQNEGLIDAFPPPAPRDLSLAAILDATCAVVAKSRLRACMLLYSPSILAVFPMLDFKPPAGDVRASMDALESVGLGGARPPTLGAVDHLLPAIPCKDRGNGSQFASFPPLGGILGARQAASRTSNSSSATWGPGRSAPPGGAAASDPDDEVPLIPWLIVLARATAGMESLLAISLLTSLYRAGFAHKNRELYLASLVVPILIQILAESSEPPLTPPPQSTAWVNRKVVSNWAIQERALVVLAHLLTDSEALQKAAFENNAVKMVCSLLKEAYEPLPASTGSLKPWSPTPAEDEADGFVDAISITASHAQLPVHRHRIRLRENALKALSALVSCNEEFRQVVSAQDGLVYVTKSLNELPSSDASQAPSALVSTSNEQQLVKASNAKGPDAAEGAASVDPQRRNPTEVLVAACHAVRMLARSVHVIRTSLQDSGVTGPLFKLLHHSDIDVQTAATAAVCNLLVDASPMREKFMELGIMKVLCEHAHSTTPALRHNALWALKHFISWQRPETKKMCMEVLDPNWLARLVSEELDDELSTDRGTDEPRQSHQPGSGTGHGGAMGEDVEMAHSDDEDGNEDGQHQHAHHQYHDQNHHHHHHQRRNIHDAMAWDDSSRFDQPQVSHERSRTGRLRRAESKLAELRDAELNPLRKARRQDLEIQEQGLNFIRNLLMTSSLRPVGPFPGVGQSQPADIEEMVDYVFNVIGKDRLFHIIASKLRARALGTWPQGSSTPQKPETAASRILYAQSKVTHAAVCVLVHIASSVPRHRQAVVAQTGLLRALSGHFASSDKEMRTAICQLLANLMLREDVSDMAKWQEWVEQLAELGLVEKLRNIQQHDEDLDVRERAKNALGNISPGSGH